MSIDTQLLNMLVCPESKAPLKLADTEMLAELNAAIAKGDVRNIGDSVVELPLSEGLLRDTGDRIYPIRDGIPVLLVDEGIAV